MTPQAVLRKAGESADVARRFFEAEAGRIVQLAQCMAIAFQHGARLFVMGNGGSATDALHVATEFCHPIIEKRRPLPAVSLFEPALLTAIANDRDFAFVFADQLALHARPGDLALLLSTSGRSPNLVRAIEAAHAREVVTIGFAGKDGGALRELADHCFVVPSFSIHRIQETHVMLYHILWDLVHVALGEDDVL
jgi:D-sedoheptulose 7-phosphate isomerase